MNLTNTIIEDTYGNVLTTGSTAGTPTSGTLQNGAGQNVTSLTVPGALTATNLSTDTLNVRDIVITQTNVAANGITSADATLLTAGTNLVTSSSTSNIALRLPAPVFAMVVGIVNNSTNALELFPHSSGGSVSGGSAGASYTIPADGLLYTFTCVQNPVVGVWTVTLPINYFRKTVVVNMVADGTHGTSGISTSSAASYNPTVTGPYGTSPNQVYYISAPPSNADWINTVEFDNYSEHRIVSTTLTSNIPSGDLTSNVNQLSSTLMGISSGQFYSLVARLKQGIQDVNTANGSSISNIDAWIGQFRETYSLDVSQGNSTSSIGHYMRGGVLCQKHEYADPNAAWKNNKMNGARSHYYAPRIQYGSGSGNMANAFPTGFSFECELTLVFEFK